MVRAWGRNARSQLHVEGYSDEHPDLWKRFSKTIDLSLLIGESSALVSTPDQSYLWKGNAQIRKLEYSRGLLDTTVNYMSEIAIKYNTINILPRTTELLNHNSHADIMR